MTHGRPPKAVSPAQEARQAQDAALEGVQPVGYCHNCGERVDDRHLFCDGLCRQDWLEDHAKGKQQNGFRR